MSIGATRRGAARSRQEDVWPGFVERVLSFVDVAAIAPLRVVIDAANGMAGAMLPPVLERLPQVDAVRCYFEPDGTFPNHEPNPLLPENREFIVRKTREEGADLGVAYDGDADRCFFVDDTGEFVPGDFVDRAARRVDPREGAAAAKVIYDVRASWAVPETIERGGRRAARSTASATRSSSTACARRTRSSAARCRRTTTSATSPRPTRASSRSCSCSSWSRSAAGSCREILAPFRERYFLTGEINTPVADVALKLQELKERYARGRGLAPRRPLVDADDWHFNVRPSNTEPLLRLNLEARSRGADGAEARRGARADPVVSRARARHRPQAAVQVRGATRASASRTPTRRARLLRPLHAVLRPCAHRVPPAPRPADSTIAAASS